MLGFLRQLRRKLIEEGHLKKYLIYAVGEVLLVMIGILLALQVNNWNQARIDNAALKDALHTIRLNLEADRRALTTNIERAENGLQFWDILQSHPMNDSLAGFFIERITIPYMPTDNAGYLSALRDNKINLIADSDLRADLISYYEKDLQDSQRYVEIMADAYSHLFEKAFDESVRLKEEASFGRRMSIVLSDPSFEEILNSYVRVAKLVLLEFHQRRDLAEALVSGIEQELND